MSGQIRFFADENFDQNIVDGLMRVQPEIDIITAAEAFMLGEADPEMLAYAADTDRVLVSHDFKTMPHFFAEFIMSGRRSPGLLLIYQNAPIRKAIEVLHIAWYASLPEDWVNTYDKLL